MIFTFVLGPNNFCELHILTTRIERATRDHGDRRICAPYTKYRSRVVLVVQTIWRQTHTIQDRWYRGLTPG